MSELDMEAYIEAQKAKLAKERRDLMQNGVSPKTNGVALVDQPPRRQWEQPENVSLAAQPLSRTENYPPDANRGLPVGGYEKKRRSLQAERQREYNEMMYKNSPQHTEPKQNGYAERIPKENVPPRRPQTPQETGLLGGRLGDYEQKRKKLDVQRKEEYNILLGAATQRTQYKPVPDTTNEQPPWLRSTQKEASAPISVPVPEQKVRSTGQRNANEAYASTLPGLRDSGSAQFRKAQIRNNEYREFLQQQEEKLKHRFDNRKPGMAAQPMPRTEADKASLHTREQDSAEVRRGRTQTRNQEYNEFLRNKQQQEDDRRRNRSQDRIHEREDYDDYAPGRRKGWGTPTYEEILEKKRREEMAYRETHDPDYARPMKLGGNNYMRSSISDGFLNEEKRLKELDREYERKKVKFQQEVDTRGPEDEFNFWERRPPPGPQAGTQQLDPRTRAKARIQSAPIDNGYQASLAIGHEDTGSAKTRRKEQYRKDLENQIAELAAAKRQERIKSIGNERSSERPRDLSPERPPYNSQLPPGYVQPTLNDDLSPRGYASGGILDRGFDFYGKSALKPALRDPAYTSYPSGQNVPPLDLYRNPLDEAYHFYATKNPLDPNLAGPSVLDSQPRRQEDPHVAPQRNTRIRFDDSPRRARAITTEDFPSEHQQRSRSRLEKEMYQAELQRQIEEKRMRKEKDKRDKDEYDRRKEEEIRNYNPFGRGGAGAPMKDRSGNLITDLRSMHKDNEDPETPRRLAEQVRQNPQQPKDSYTSPRSYEPSVKQPAGTAGAHARGEGFFGEPGKSDAEKTATDRYKEELQRQIDEKKSKKAEEDAKQKAEEEKEMKRIEEERNKMQKEFDEELKRQKAKEEETRRKNEEIKLLAEEKKAEAERLKKEAEDKRQEEVRRKQDDERAMRQQAEQRSDSPPIPTMRTKTDVSTTEPRGSSPPVPTLRSKTEPDRISLRGRSSPPVPAVHAQNNSEFRAQSSDVLNQLARMRQQLQSERRRVENALEKQHNSVDVYDPRLDEERLFAIARAHNRKPDPDPVNPVTVEEFNKLKHRGDLPDSGRPSPASRLQADTAFIDLESGMQNMPSDLSDLPRHNTQRNDQARQRRRERTPARDTPSITPRKTSDGISIQSNPMGSTVSLDPDRITRKNQERLRRLRTLAGDDVSLADPDDVLDRFMAKQHHNRPPSGQTLQDDTWLRPDSRN